MRRVIIGRNITVSFSMLTSQTKHLLGHPEPALHRLTLELLRHWEKQAVDANYQNYYLNYLDTLPAENQEEQINQEIKYTLENRSHFFRIQKAMDLRQEAADKLRAKVQRL